MKLNFKKPRGSILLFTIVLVIPLLLLMAGVAVDVSILYVVRSELHRAMDAASLAGAGKLGFDDTVFPTVRQNSVTYAANNPYRFGGISLVLNTVNANSPMFPDVLPANWPWVLTPPGGVTQAAGDVVLGIWDPTTSPPFTPSLDGTIVNAVQCRAQTNVPTNFLRLLGLTSLPISAQSTAVANPPTTAPACVFPIGVSSCPFLNNGAWTSQGCGVPISFITSSGNPAGPPPGTNTGAWLGIGGLTANASNVRSELAAAANGSCAQNPAQGDTVDATNGMIQTVMDDFANYFVPKYNASEVTTVTNASTPPVTVYQGKGWVIYIPVLNTSCPPQAINGNFAIQTFTRFVVTQVLNGGECKVNNPALATYDPAVQAVCDNPPPPSTRAIFGHLDCAVFDSMPVVIPTPRSALATRLRLVQ